MKYKLKKTKYMKNLILILFAIVCFSSCQNRSLASDPSKTTIEEIENLKSDTTTYKVIVDGNNKITVYNKETNLRVYEMENSEGALNTVLIFGLIAILICLIFVAVI